MLVVVVGFIVICFASFTYVQRRRKTKKKRRWSCVISFVLCLVDGFDGGATQHSSSINVQHGTTDDDRHKQDHRYLDLLLISFVD